MNEGLWERLWSDGVTVAGGALSLFIFLALFIGVLVWVFRPGSKRTYQRRARLPLDDSPDNHNGAS